MASWRWACRPARSTSTAAGHTLAHLPRLDLPILDLYGSEDLPEVIASTAKRRQAAGSGDYTQSEIEGADHFFDGEEEQLLEAVNGWLDARY